MTTPAYFLNVTPDELARFGIVGALTIEHKDLRAMHDALEALIAKLKKSPSPPELVKALRLNILVTGDTGTGKELVAKAFRQRLIREGILKEGDRWYGAVNCGCLSPDTLEIELFATAEGAFTDATNQVGLVPRLAGYKIDPKKKCLIGGGTEPALLFLDEIGSASLDVQSKLLRLLENRDFSPLGMEGRYSKAPFLIMLSATNELEPDAGEPSRVGPELANTAARRKAPPADGAPSHPEFRRDLFYRLGDTFHFHLPPLSERQGDILHIAQQFYQRYFQLLFDPQAKPVLPEKLADLLLDRPWPGNGRQLHQVIRRAMILWDGEAPEMLTQIIQAQVPKQKSRR